MDEQQIMSVREFRKVVGKPADNLSDDEITVYISQLDFIAGLFIKNTLRKDSEDETSNR